MSGNVLTSFDSTKGLRGEVVGMFHSQKGRPARGRTERTYSVGKRPLLRYPLL